MRLAYLAPAALGLLLVGCGPDEPEEVTPPPPATEQPAAPGTGTTGPGSTPMNEGTQADQPAGVGSPAVTDEPMNPPTDDNGSGMGTESGAGTAPAPGGTSQ